MSWDVESFRLKLEQEHTFPGDYLFKFIVPREKREEILNILPKGSHVKFRESSNKKYVSITGRAKLKTSQGVLDVYFAANKVDGCIAL